MYKIWTLLHQKFKKAQRTLTGWPKESEEESEAVKIQLNISFYFWVNS